jgi:DNA repair protein RadA/Sms
VAKTRSVFFCNACGFESTRWLGRCPQCEAWNSFDERSFAVPARAGKAVAAARHAAAAPLELRAIDSAKIARVRSGMAEFDAVLGGGIVPGSVTLIVYICGEESAAQVKLRAQRLRIDAPLLVHAETNLRVVLDALEKVTPIAVIVDSIQTVWLPDAESYAGSVTQIRDCTQALMEFAKRSGCATFIVGHVTKDGAIAGPRLLEHLVDTVLYFEGETNGEYRILRAYKNRFGSIDEICVFAMHDRGLEEVVNPSELFLAGQKERPSGSCVVASIVGSRPVLIEVQALVGETSYGTPRRLANNLDQGRLAMILAVLERRVGMHLGTHDVYASVAGGLRVNEPAADLGIALAIASSFRDRPLPAHAVAFGELGLSGELRGVSAGARREAEARKLGYRTIISPEQYRDVASAIAAVLS